jgi:magnesium-protoporphyrin IX monomethyl ester (oxidative) cyclase
MNAVSGKLQKIKRVLLINNFSYSGEIRNISIDPVVVRHSGQEIKTGITFPIGLAYIGAMLQAAGFSVKIIDPIAQKVSIKMIHAATDSSDAVVIPYSPYHHQDIRSYFGSFGAKAHILVGQIATYLSDSILQEGGGDVVIYGEPEKTVVEVCTQWPYLKDIPGVIFRESNGSIHTTPQRELIQDLDSIPFPLRDFIHPRAYWDLLLWGRPTAFVLPSRGCVFDCIFCAQLQMNKKTVRQRTVKNIIDEIESIIRQTGVRNVLFHDETFNLNDAFVVGVCEEILSRNMKIRWACAGRADLIKANSIRLMKKSGCIHMTLGLESANDHILRYLQKRQKVTDIRRGLQILQKEKMTFSLQCIFGSPGENSQTIDNTMNFIWETKPFFVSFNVLTPLPGSSLFEQVKGSLDLNDSLKDMDILHTRFSFCDYSTQELAGLIRDVYKRYYLSFYFIRRVIGEIIDNPGTFFWMAKTMFFQIRYFYFSITKMHKPQDKRSIQ